MQNPATTIILPGCDLDNVEVDSDMMIVKARVSGTDGLCPECMTRSVRVHSYYTRTINDLPVGEYGVRVKLRVRRFRCLNSQCQRKTFTEQLPQLAAPHAQRTHRLARAFYDVICFLSAEAGSRLLGRLHMKTSGDTLLRHLRQMPLPAVQTPRVLGIDDWAQRKGRTYGTILVDLERHQVVDLLPDRTAGTLAQWLQAHPGVAIITRDRSTEYARGASEGAPEVLQVADRWHLLLNLRQVLERYLTQVYGRLKQLLCQMPEGSEEGTDLFKQRGVPYARTRIERRTSQASRERRLALYERVQEFKRNGNSILSISRQMNLHRATVRKFYYTDAFPERSQRKLMPSILDPYYPIWRNVIVKAVKTQASYGANSESRGIVALEVRFTSGYSRNGHGQQPRHRRNT